MLSTLSQVVGFNMQIMFSSHAKLSPVIVDEKHSEKVENYVLSWKDYKSWYPAVIKRRIVLVRSAFGIVYNITNRKQEKVL